MDMLSTELLPPNRKTDRRRLCATGQKRRRALSCRLPGTVTVTLTLTFCCQAAKPFEQLPLEREPVGPAVAGHHPRQPVAGDQTAVDQAHHGGNRGSPAGGQAAIRVGTAAHPRSVDGGQPIDLRRTGWPGRPGRRN